MYVPEHQSVASELIRTKSIANQFADSSILVAAPVINDPKSWKKTGDILVVPDEDMVMTRFFFVYEKSEQVAVHSTSESFIQEVLSAIQHFVG
jgi:hypothetical protein